MTRNPRAVLIVGATSGIARSLVHEFARRKYAVILAARDEEELAIVAADLRVRYGGEIYTQSFDALNYRSHTAFWKRCLQDCDGDLYGVVVCHGTMTPQDEAERDFAAAKAMIESNYTSAVCIINLAANYLEEQGRGFICALSSVAGEKGRRSNYIYGSAKGGLSLYLQGLRQRLAKSNVSVTTVKPGPVDTGMTFGMDKLPLLASPEKVASDIFRSVRRRKDVVYTPAPWLVIMGILKLIPEFIWKKVDL